MKTYAEQIDGLGIGVIFEQEPKDMLSEIDEEFHHESGDIDVNDPRLTSESIAMLAVPFRVAIIPQR